VISQQNTLCQQRPNFSYIQLHNYNFFEGAFFRIIELPGKTGEIFDSKGVKVIVLRTKDLDGRFRFRVQSAAPKVAIDFEINGIAKAIP
jgi:hypothetical protein